MPDAVPLQGELNFGQEDARGYARWQAEQAEWLAQRRKDFGLPIGRLVRVKLRDFDKELRGRLGLVELPLQAPSARRATLRVGPLEFAPDEIEYCLRED